MIQKMDLQRRKEARRDTPAAQEEGMESPLDIYSGNSHSQFSPKNDSLGRNRDARKADSTNGARRPQMSETFTQNAPQPSRALPPSSPKVAQSGLSPSSKTIRIPSALGLGPIETERLITTNKYPPVTKSTLSELDLPCIMANISLRMDAYFERDLQFKPDLDGEKGRRKRRDAADYWDAIAAEISVYAYFAPYGGENNFERCLGGEESRFEPRLPAMFETLQDVLKTLVLERDHPNIMQNLEVTLLMQQIQKGVLDMVGIAKWLAALLKTYCAPMRDEWVDRMVRHVSSRSQTQNARETALGLQTLFAILETMKLDVANHQIRAFRVFLVEDTIPFLQEYFKIKIEREEFQVASSQLWYQDIRARELRTMDHPTQTNGFWPLSPLFQGLSELLLDFHKPLAFPETFTFDEERLWHLRVRLQNAINLEICWDIFKSYIHSQRRYLSAPTQTCATFRSRIGTLMEENEDCIRGSSRWLKNVRCIALEIARFACCGDATVPDDVIRPIEASVEWHLSKEHNIFQRIQHSLRKKLLEATLATAKRYVNMSPHAICEAQRNPSYIPSDRYDVERISTRLAHIGVLHWKVWAPLLYVHESVLPTDESMFPSESEVA